MNSWYSFRAHNGRCSDKLWLKLTCTTKKGVKNPLNLEQKVKIFQLFSSEPKYGHILAKKPTTKKTKVIYFQTFGNFMKSQCSWFLSILVCRLIFGLFSFWKKEVKIHILLCYLKSKYGHISAYGPKLRKLRILYFPAKMINFSSNLFLHFV